MILTAHYDVLYLIFELLDLQAIKSCSLVSRKFRENVAEFLWVSLAVRVKPNTRGAAQGTFTALQRFLQNGTRKYVKHVRVHFEDWDPISDDPAHTTMYAALREASTNLRSLEVHFKKDGEPASVAEAIERYGLQGMLPHPVVDVRWRGRQEEEYLHHFTTSLDIIFTDHSHPIQSHLPTLKEVQLNATLYQSTLGWGETTRLKVIFHAATDRIAPSLVPHSTSPTTYAPPTSPLQP